MYRYAMLKWWMLSSLRVLRWKRSHFMTLKIYKKLMLYLPSYCSLSYLANYPRYKNEQFGIYFKMWSSLSSFFSNRFALLHSGQLMLIIARLFWQILGVSWFHCILSCVKTLTSSSCFLALNCVSWLSPSVNSNRRRLPFKKKHFFRISEYCTSKLASSRQTCWKSQSLHWWSYVFTAPTMASPRSAVWSGTIYLDSILILGTWFFALLAKASHWM